MTVDDSPLALAETQTGGGHSEPGVADPGTLPGGQQDAPAGQPPDPAAVIGTIVARAMDPVVQNFQRELGTLRAELNQLRDRGARAEATPGVPGKPGAPESKEAKLERFVSDPDAYEADLIGKAEQRVMQRLAPYLAGPAYATQESTLASEASRIDATYGPGTFDEVVRPQLESGLRHFDEATRYDPRAIRTAVAALVGSAQLQPILDQRREAFRKAQATQAVKARDRRQGPPSFLGGGRTTLDADGRPLITAEDRLVMDALDRAGFKVSETELRAIRTIPKGLPIDEQLEAYERALGTNKGKAA